jgi:hypothetical protein
MLGGSRRRRQGGGATKSRTTTHPRRRVSSPRIPRTPPRGTCRCRSARRTWSASNRTRVARSARRRPSPIPRVLRRASNGGRPAHRRRQVRWRRGGGGRGRCSSSEASLVCLIAFPSVSGFAEIEYPLVRALGEESLALSELAGGRREEVGLDGGWAGCAASRKP